MRAFTTCRYAAMDRKECSGQWAEGSGEWTAVLWIVGRRQWTSERVRLSWRWDALPASLALVGSREAGSQAPTVPTVQARKPVILRRARIVVAIAVPPIINRPVRTLVRIGVAAAAARKEAESFAFPS